MRKIRIFETRIIERERRLNETHHIILFHNE